KMPAAAANKPPPTSETQCEAEIGEGSWVGISSALSRNETNRAAVAGETEQDEAKKKFVPDGAPTSFTNLHPCFRSGVNREKHVRT
ncbi:MAG: hypothetical protein IMHGJWDQ_001817, partial [Candidatus Fervidibacter sp.]